MNFDYRTSRVAKILVDSTGKSFAAVQQLLCEQTLEIFIGEDATSPAAHAAALTAIATASRTFLGGVRVTGSGSQPINCQLPIVGETIDEAAQLLGARGFAGHPARRICIGTPSLALPQTSYVWWRGWQSGCSLNPTISLWSDNPLVGISGGALAVGAAFEALRSRKAQSGTMIDLWPNVDGAIAPDFGDVFLPNGLWLFGLGNLGQAFLWSLSALPYAHGSMPTVYLQDFDRVSEENWGTSILVGDDSLGKLKTRIAEDWALNRAFNVHRIDRKLVSSPDRQGDEPSIAMCGFDNAEARALLGEAEFPVMIDAGLGRRAESFDRFRVTIFDSAYRPSEHFGGEASRASGTNILEKQAYKELEAQIGDCGAAQIAGASVAVPHVSAVAAAVALSRAISIVSGKPIFRAEARNLRHSKSRKEAPVTIASRELLNAGRPVLTK